jgi:phenylalanine-4-hydroxylase
VKSRFIFTIFSKLISFGQLKLHAPVFEQFPNLQVFGEAGAGKSQSVIMLSRLHWYRNSHGLATATSYTPFAIDTKR